MIEKADSEAIGADDDTKEPSQLEENATFVRLKKWFRADFDHSSAWRANAKLNFAAFASDQWSPADRAALDEQKRPVITFNRIISVVKSICGMEVNGRHETIYLPRGTQPGVVKANELLSQASQWMGDCCDAEDEQSEAFQDCVICGMGWTEQTIEYEEDPDGSYDENKIDPLEMVWDNASRSKNLVDARRLFRVRKMTMGEARALAEALGEENVFDEDLDAPWAIGGGDDVEAKAVEERRHRFENSKGSDESGIVHLVHAQWIEREPYFRVVHPDTGELVSLGKAEFEAMRLAVETAGGKLKFVKQTRKVYKQALLGGRILGGVRPGLAKDRFTFQCITGERDRNKGTWFGLVDLMRDPQMWANKWLSQTLHILNTTAKGGIIAESDAFEDQRAAQETYAQPDSITWAAKGAIAKGKIMQKPGAGISNGYVNLLQFAISSIRDVTGVNQEILGMRDVNQPGVLEAQRKQAAMTILATLFDSLRRYRKNVGRVRLHLIQEYLADGRLIRITGEEGAQTVQLLKEQTMGNYEVIVDDAPSSPNQKQETWATLQMMLPVFREMLTPEAVLAILEYSPLPTQVVEAFKKMASKPNPDADRAKELAERERLAKIEKDEATAYKARTGADVDRLQGILDLVNAGMAIPAGMPEPQEAALPLISEPDGFAISPTGFGDRVPPPAAMIPDAMEGPEVPKLPFSLDDVSSVPTNPNIR